MHLFFLVLVALTTLVHVSGSRQSERCEELKGRLAGFANVKSLDSYNEHGCAITMSIPESTVTVKFWEKFSAYGFSVSTDDEEVFFRVWTTGGTDKNAEAIQNGNKWTLTDKNKLEHVLVEDSEHVVTFSSENLYRFVRNQDYVNLQIMPGKTRPGTFLHAGKKIWPSIYIGYFDATESVEYKNAGDTCTERYFGMHSVTVSKNCSITSEDAGWYYSSFFLDGSSMTKIINPKVEIETGYLNPYAHLSMYKTSDAKNERLEIPQIISAENHNVVNVQKKIHLSNYQAINYINYEGHDVQIHKDDENGDFIIDLNHLNSTIEASVEGRKIFIQNRNMTMISFNLDTKIFLISGISPLLITAESFNTRIEKNTAELQRVSIVCALQTFISEFGIAQDLLNGANCDGKWDPPKVPQYRNKGFANGRWHDEI